MSVMLTTVDRIRTPQHRYGRVGGWATLIYGLLCYAVFGVTILYAIGFLGGLPVPKTVNDGAARPLGESLLVNAGLLSLFVVQHTIMARPAFKRWWTRFIPEPAERSTFVLTASACLGLLFWQWRPMPQVIWSLTGPVAWLLTGLSLAGWAIVLIASATISHMDLFGVRQAWLRFRNRPYAPVGFRLAGLYRLVRHPLMLGFLIAFWSAPTMTLGRLFFAVMTTGYVLFGTWIEERDLIAAHGERYLDYKRRVPGLIPWPRPSVTVSGAR